jgi:hypothetical protein
MKIEATEQDWLNAVKRIFDFASKQKPPRISQSEIESLLMGLTGLKTKPFGKPLSDAGEKAIEMLNGYLQIMKKKKKHFLPIKA